MALQGALAQAVQQAQGQTGNGGLVTPTPQQSFSDKIYSGLVGAGKAVVAPVVGLGNEIAAGIGGNANAGNVVAQNKQLSDIDLNNIKTFQNIRQQQQAKGQDTSHIDQVIKNYQTSSGQQLSDLYPAINDSNEKVIGNTIGTILLATSGGALNSGAEAATSGGLKQALASGAKIGATYGGVGGAANAMSQDASAGDVLKSGVIGAGTGAVVGAGVSGLAKGASSLLGSKASSYESTLQNAQNANAQTGTEAVNSIHEASNVMGDVNKGIQNQASQAPQIISKIDPTASVTYPKEFVDQLNALKDTKAWSLPDSIREPDFQKINADGSLTVNPQQAQDLQTSLNDLKFNSKGDVVVNNQTSNLVNKIKTLNQSGLGHVTDAQGNSIWNQWSQDYHQSKDAMDAMSNLIPQKSSVGGLLDPTEVNNSVNKIMKMMETPSGRAALIQGDADFTKATGYSLLKDPMGAISKLADSNEDVAKALKGSYGHQFVQGLKNPTAVSRRVLYAASTILGITALGTAFRKQIGGLFTGQ